MPRLTFPFAADGLLVPAMVGLATPAMQALQARGHPLPRLVRAKGMLDSGSTVTAVAPWVLAQLNASPGATAPTQTASGNVVVRMYKISFTIHPLVRGGPTLFRRDWSVTNLAKDPDDVDILFGLDLLHQIVVTIDGPAQSFTMDF